MKKKEPKIDNSLATVKVMKFLEENSNKKFSNQSIAEALKLSSSTVSAITSRLSALGVIVSPAFRKNKTSFSPFYQDAKGSNISVSIEKKEEDVAVLIQNLLDSNKNKTFTKIDLINELDRPVGSISSALHSLLVTNKIKIVDISGSVKFQSSKGRGKGIDISFNVNDSDSLTVSEYSKLRELSSKEEKKLRQELANKKYSLIYSSQGFRRAYLISDLDKIKKNKIDKKSLLSMLSFNKSYKE